MSLSNWQGTLLRLARNTRRGHGHCEYMAYNKEKDGLLADWNHLADLAYLVISYQAKLFSFALLLGCVALDDLRMCIGSRACAKRAMCAWCDCPCRTCLLAVVAGALGGLALGVWMKHYHASLPYLDAMLTSFSILAVGGRHASISLTGGCGLWWTLFMLANFSRKSSLTALLYAAFVALAIVDCAIGGGGGHRRGELRARMGILAQRWAIHGVSDTDV